MTLTEEVWRSTTEGLKCILISALVGLDHNEDDKLSHIPVWE